MDGRLRRVIERQQAAVAEAARVAEDAASRDARPLVVRYIHRGESLRNGRVLPLPQGAAELVSGGSSEAAGEQDLMEVSGEVVLGALGSAAANLPLQRLIPYFYSRRHEGWQRLYRRSRIPGKPQCELERPPRFCSATLLL